MHDPPGTSNSTTTEHDYHALSHSQPIAQCGSREEAIRYCHLLSRNLIRTWIDGFRIDYRCEVPKCSFALCCVQGDMIGAYSVWQKGQHNHSAALTPQENPMWNANQTRWNSVNFLLKIAINISSILPFYRYSRIAKFRTKANFFQYIKRHSHYSLMSSADDNQQIMHLKCTGSSNCKYSLRCIEGEQKALTLWASGRHNHSAKMCEACSTLARRITRVGTKRWTAPPARPKLKSIEYVILEYNSINIS